MNNDAMMLAKKLNLNIFNVFITIKGSRIPEFLFLCNFLNPKTQQQNKHIQYSYCFYTLRVMHFIESS